MKELRRLLQAYLLTVHDRVYYQLAPEDAVYPYLVIDFPAAYDDGEWTQTVSVDVDGWDIPADGDTTVLETLMESVRTGLNKKTFLSSELGATFFIESRLALQDDDKRIKRRKYIFEAHLFERSN